MMKWPKFNGLKLFDVGIEVLAESHRIIGPELTGRARDLESSRKRKGSSSGRPRCPRTGYTIVRMAESETVGT